MATNSSPIWWPAFISPTVAVGTYTFTGGTGRFKNASGEADFESVTSDGIHFALTFEGTISSPRTEPVGGAPRLSKR